MPSSRPPIYIHPWLPTALGRRSHLPLCLHSPALWPHLSCPCAPALLTSCLFPLHSELLPHSEPLHMLFLLLVFYTLGPLFPKLALPYPSRPCYKCYLLQEAFPDYLAKGGFLVACHLCPYVFWIVFFIALRLHVIICLHMYWITQFVNYFIEFLYLSLYQAINSMKAGWVSVLCPQSPAWSLALSGHSEMFVKWMNEIHLLKSCLKEANHGPMQIQVQIAGLGTYWQYVLGWVMKLLWPQSSRPILAALHRTGMGIKWILNCAEFKGRAWHREVLRGVGFLFLLLFLLFRAAPVAYGVSQARGKIRATAASLCMPEP